MKFPGLANLSGGLTFFFCFSLFTFQLFGLLKSWLSPTTTNTYVEEVPLESMDFPLEIILCVKPGLNATALKDLGYAEAFAYAAGTSMFNYDLVGWGGHDEKGDGLKSAPFDHKVLMKTIVENNITLELRLLDKNLLVNRKIEKLSFFSTGNTMVMKNSQLSNYIVKIKKNVFVEEDPRKSCRNYPNAEFSSFAECDDQYMRERIDQVAPNLTPAFNLVF